jgi:hypothetical protein
LVSKGPFHEEKNHKISEERFEMFSLIFFQNVGAILTGITNPKKYGYRTLNRNM